MIHFLADPHFDWPGIALNRGFASAKEHDDYIIDAINHHVPRFDRLIILGDFGGNRPGHFRERIKCHEVWNIWGNHDKETWKIHFSQTYHHKTIRLSDGFHVCLHHYPTAYWDGSHKGWGHLYGHVHNQREATLDAAFPGRRSMDVSVDALMERFGFEDFRPITEGEVSEILQSRPGHDDVEFYRTNFGKY